MPEVKLYALRVDGREEEVPFEGAVPSLDPLSKIVGGHIEMLPYFNRYRGEFCIAFCNEDGKSLRLQPNEKGHAAWEVAANQPIHMDQLVGDIAIVTGDARFLRDHL